MKPSDATAVDRFLYPLVASTLLLGVLVVWQRTYEQSCLALVSPGLVYLAVFCGLLEYRLERKRFALDYYLDHRSPWRGKFQGSWVPAVVSLVAAVPLALFLVVFVALSEPTDWLFLSSASVLAPILFVGLSIWPGRHFRRGEGEDSRGIAVAEILTARLAGWGLLGLIAGSYAYINYRMIPIPAHIYLDSLQLTVEAFTAPVRSACPAVAGGLEVAAGIDGVAWFLVARAATTRWIPDGISVIVWIGFFLNAALAMVGFLRGLEGSILAAWRIAGRTRRGPTDAG
ncbi:MAG: hypothetical protein OXT72_03800 [Gammaproteobacteria bacterium]|nr:hypothetical protein [Gammaproteobacteria bacterium]MDE0248168.1 hypothetical protein [Gammaproteobacteria bacterium]